MYVHMKPKQCIANPSLIPRPPHPTGERWSGTVASNSWFKRQTSFPLKKDVHYPSPVGCGSLGMRLMKPKHELQGVKELQYLRSHLLRCIILLVVFTV